MARVAPDTGPEREAVAGSWRGVSGQSSVRVRWELTRRRPHVVPPRWPTNRHALLLPVVSLLGAAVQHTPGAPRSPQLSSAGNFSEASLALVNSVTVTCHEAKPGGCCNFGNLS